jgi:hypothetical protein
MTSDSITSGMTIPLRLVSSRMNTKDEEGDELKKAAKPPPAGREHAGRDNGATNWRHREAVDEIEQRAMTMMPIVGRMCPEA